MIVDANVWIEHFRDRLTIEVAELRAALRAQRAVFLLPVVLQEVLQGTQNAMEFARYRQLLEQIPLTASVDERAPATFAAQLYAGLRWKGVTVPPNDCLIAASAILANLPVLTGDPDFTRIRAHDQRLRLL